MKINKSHIVLFFVLILISASVSAGFFDFLTGWVTNTKSKNYDIVIVGAGNGGIAAAIQAARMGTKVALLEETNDIGGQMITVPTMDEGSLKKERDDGLYAEFVNNII